MSNINGPWTRLSCMSSQVRHQPYPHKNSLGLCRIDACFVVIKRLVHPYFYCIDTLFFNPSHTKLSERKDTIQQQLHYITIRVTLASILRPSFFLTFCCSSWNSLQKYQTESPKKRDHVGLILKKHKTKRQALKQATQSDPKSNQLLTLISSERTAPSATILSLFFISDHPPPKNQCNHFFFFFFPNKHCFFIFIYFLKVRIIKI